MRLPINYDQLSSRFKRSHLVVALLALGQVVGLAEENPEYRYPKIQQHGKVIRLPNASHQPRDQSKIVVDITKGSEPENLSSAIDKVARFVNIYAGAGQHPASVQISVVLHGDATLHCLTHTAYKSKFGVERNPNLELIRTLKEAGVKFYVCGQSLIGKESQPSDVSPDVSVSVSALSALVNLQQDGYAYLPMLK